MPPRMNVDLPDVEQGGEQADMLSRLDSAADYGSHPRVLAGQGIDREDGATGRTHARDDRRVHDGERRAGLMIEKADKPHVARQVVRVVPLEDVHRLGRNMPARHPGQHGQRKALMRHVHFRSRRRLHVSGTQCLEAGGQRRKDGTGLDERCHVGRREIAD